MSMQMLILAVALVANPPTPAEEALAHLQKAGDAVIDALPEIKPGFRRESFLETFVGWKSAGFSRSVLLGVKKDERSFYQYSVDGMVRQVDGSIFEMKTRATLDRYLSPLRIRWDSILTSPDGKKTESGREVILEAKQIRIIVKDAAGARERKIRRPSGRFVYLTGMLISMLDVKDRDKFILRDIDPETGVLALRTYSIRGLSAGKSRVGVSRHRSSTEEFYYIRDADRSIEEHISHGMKMPITFKVASRERVAKIEAALRRK